MPFLTLSIFRRGGVGFEIAPQAALRNTNYCLSLVTGRQASTILTQAIADPQLQQLQQYLQVRGFNPNFNAAKVYSGPQCASVSVPIGPQANLYYVRTHQGTSVTAVTSQERRRIHLQPDGTSAEVLLLTRDQVRGILAQVGNVLHQHGITSGYVWAIINEVTREVWLTIKGRQALYLAVLEASTWSESGPVTTGIVKYGPKQLGCETAAGASNKLDAQFGLGPQTQLTPLGEQLKFTPCEETGCGGSDPIYIWGIECGGSGGQDCDVFCEIWGATMTCIRRCYPSGDPFSPFFWVCAGR